MAKGPPQIFDRRAYAQARARAAKAGGELILMRDAAEHMAERIAVMKPDAGSALDLGSRDESFAVLAPAATSWVRTTAYPSQHMTVDEEVLPFAPATFDLVTSVLALHAVNDLPGALAQIRRILRPGGLFLAALFGGATLTELRQSFAAGEAEVTGGASPRVAPFADVRDLGALLQRAGFSGPVADVERTVIRYKDISRLFADLRALGETNVLVQRSRKALGRATLRASVAHYAAIHTDSDGRLAATFDVLYLTGKT
jgi:SAM-dependent methyltransferase